MSIFRLNHFFGIEISSSNQMIIENLNAKFSELKYKFSCSYKNIQN
jgi:hypothetical protein